MGSQESDMAEQLSTAQRIVYLKFVKKIDLNLLTTHTNTHIHSGKYIEVMGMLISLIVVMFSQCISKHQVVYLKNIQFLYIKDISVKVLKKIQINCQRDHFWHPSTLAMNPLSNQLLSAQGLSDVL